MNDHTPLLNGPRQVFAGAALVLPPATIAMTFLIWRDGLPERIASHWSDLGAADDSLPTVGVLLTALIGSGVAMLAGLALIALPKVNARTTRGALFWVGMVQGLAAAIWLIPAWLTYQAGSAEDAVLGPWIIVLAACTLYGAVPYAIYPRAAIADAHSPEPLPLSPTETGAWSRTITARIFVWVAVFIVALTIAIMIPITFEADISVAWFALLVMVVSIVAVVAFIRLRITVDWRGLRVVSWLFAIPLKRIPLDRIRTVESTELRPSEWGGWGYRVMPGRSAVILRGGEGLVVTTTDDKQFAITLDDADTPAALLIALSAPPQPAPQEGTQ